MPLSRVAAGAARRRGPQSRPHRPDRAPPPESPWSPVRQRPLVVDPIGRHPHREAPAVGRTGEPQPAQRQPITAPDNPVDDTNGAWWRNSTPDSSGHRRLTCARTRRRSAARSDSQAVATARCCPTASSPSSSTVDNPDRDDLVLPVCSQCIEQQTNSPLPAALAPGYLPGNIESGRYWDRTSDLFRVNEPDKCAVTSTNTKVGLKGVRSWALFACRWARLSAVQRALLLQSAPPTPRVPCASRWVSCHRVRHDHLAGVQVRSPSWTVTT
jgi:hypothetical protein